MPPEGRRAAKQRLQRPAVDKIRNCRACKVGEGRREIDVKRHLAHDSMRRYAGAADDQRHADVLLVSGALPLPEAMLAEMKAVVGSKEDVRIVEPPVLLQLLDDRRDHIVA